MPRTVRTLFALLSLLLLVGTAVSTSPAQVAFAKPKPDLNARQIQFYCQSPMSVVFTIRGSNQSHDKVAGTFLANRVGSSSSRQWVLETTGWWWVGPVTIGWYDQARPRPNWHSETVPLPTPSKGDTSKTVTIDCPL